MKTLLTSFLIFITTLAFSQKDRVYIKNGDKIRGTLTEKKSKDSIRVKMDEGEIILSLAVVEEIHFKKSALEKSGKYSNNRYEQGYYATLKGGVMFGNHSYEDPFKIFFMFEGIYEYHHHQLLNAGVGTGMNFYDKYISFPLYAQYQAVLGKKNRSLFFYGQAGHGFIKEKRNNEEFYDVDSGRYLACGFGVQKRIGDGFLRYQLGLISQRVKEKTAPIISTDWPLTYEDYVTQKRDMIRFLFSVSYSL